MFIRLAHNDVSWCLNQRQCQGQRLWRYDADAPNNCNIPDLLPAWHQSGIRAALARGISRFAAVFCNVSQPSLEYEAFTLWAVVSALLATALPVTASVVVTLTSPHCIEGTKAMIVKKRI